MREKKNINSLKVSFEMKNEKFNLLRKVMRSFVFIIAIVDLVMVRAESFKKEAKVDQKKEAVYEKISCFQNHSTMLLSERQECLW